MAKIYGEVEDLNAKWLRETPDEIVQTGLMTYYGPIQYWKIGGEFFIVSITDNAEEKRFAWGKQVSKEMFDAAKALTEV